MLPAYNPTGPIDPTDPDDKIRSDKFCKGNEGTWSPDLWNELGVGTWLDQRSRWYSGRPEGWPRPKGVPEKAGVPRTISNFKLLTEDSFFNWPGVCINIESQCTITFTTDFENRCRTDWERAYSLFAMANFARFIHRFAIVFEEETSNAAFDLAAMANIFIADQKKNLEVGAGAWLTMAAGAVTGITAFLPGFGAMAGAAASGILGIASSMAGGADDPAITDPRFTSFANLSSSYGNIKIKVVDTIKIYFKKILLDQPATGNIEEGTRLSNILKSGAYSDQYIGMSDSNGESSDADFNGKLLRKMIKAPIISEIWNSQRMFIAKFPPGLLDYTWKGAPAYWNFKFDPCYGKREFEDTLNGKIYCPHGEGGLGENNFVLLSWDSWSNYMFNDYGTAQATISKVGIDKSEMVISAVRVQDTAKEFMPRRPNVMSDMFLEMANNPDKAPLHSHALFVNIPVCDLTNLDLKWDNQVCFITDDNRPSDEALYLDCLSYVLRESCSDYKVNGHPWPYDKKVHGFKTVP